MRWSGGLCPDGPCGVALSTDSETGTWHLHDGYGAETLDDGTTHPADVAELGGWLHRHWDELTATSFTGTCPTAYDGQELTLEIITWPDDPLADADWRTTTSCTHAWPAEVVDELTDRWADAGLPAWPARP